MYNVHSMFDDTAITPNVEYFGTTNLKPFSGGMISLKKAFAQKSLLQGFREQLFITYLYLLSEMVALIFWQQFAF